LLKFLFYIKQKTQILRFGFYEIVIFYLICQLIRYPLFSVVCFGSLLYENLAIKSPHSKLTHNLLAMREICCCIFRVVFICIFIIYTCNRIVLKNDNVFLLLKYQDRVRNYLPGGITLLTSSVDFIKPTVIQLN
jgi:hypothetical protein